jgi:hypothetical protein
MMSVPDPKKDDAVLGARRRKRNIALGLALAAFVLIFYVLTIAKLGPAVFNREL